VAATQRAPERQKEPMESCLKGVPVAYAPEIDRSAMWAPCQQHMFTVPPLGPHHRAFRSGDRHMERRFRTTEQRETILCLPLPRDC
jgi:hypothetical protein